MKIGITGPNRIYNGNVEERKKILDEVAEMIAKSGNEIILTPDKNSLLEHFGKRYLELGGKKVWLVVPTEEADHENYLSTKIGEIMSSKDWSRQADEFTKNSDVLLCVGYAWGALKEIACAQYSKGKKVYIIKEFISSKLPKELNFLVEYISLGSLKKLLPNKFPNDRHKVRKN